MQSSGSISLNTSDTVHIVKIEDILYCKSDNSYTTFFLAGQKSVVVSQSIKKVEQSLAKSDFIRTHQTYLVNIKHIKEIKKTNLFSVILSDNSIIPVSTRKRKEVMQKLLNDKILNTINNSFKS